ncbi:hypothetical protein A8C75_18070 [Marinobacterium aestuarii]|uniref:Uncharacterized protein n=1 Tax=Marinobacterium aestuarii TaxID=1821621 RepID=A0A1A9F266_9GAMM|nr:hypothetical protein [Marinobacterium aestuarii]ANG64192.1 hypothetical protein A8C75_18070 [Marinobacterium aestuarii]
MSKKPFGPSLYYASDKNVFEALTQRKVDVQTIYKLFESRNILISKKTSRDELAKYFARLNHDYYDHRDISSKLGVVPRRERITSMDIIGDVSVETIKICADALKKEMQQMGDVVQISRNGDNLAVNIQYSSFNYKLSEFSQVQVRDGVIEFIKTDAGYIIRNTQNDFINSTRDLLVIKAEKSNGVDFEKNKVSLFDITSHKLRNKFFYNLINTIPEHPKVDVTDVYVYKAKPDMDENETNELDQEFNDVHIERVLLRGRDVTRSELLNELVDDDTYYIIKAGWNIEDKLGTGNVYAVEAVFSDPVNCTGFSFLLRRVYPSESGKVSSRFRAPSKGEVDLVSRIIENRSRDLVLELREEFFGKK